jgi:hypothetical protein
VAPENDFTATFCSVLDNSHPFTYFIIESPATTTVFLFCCCGCCSCCSAFACYTSCGLRDASSLVVFFFNLDFFFFFCCT